MLSSSWHIPPRGQDSGSDDPGEAHHVCTYTLTGECRHRLHAHTHGVHGVHTPRPSTTSDYASCVQLLISQETSHENLLWRVSVEVV